MPSRFCWTKFGAEAGEAAQEILDRKEHERAANRGLFLWGIGNSVAPSLLALLASTPQPQVLFTPMLSAAAAKDRSPRRVGRWTTAVGLDGDPFDMPAASTVTSRLSDAGASQRHYALVCRSDTPLHAAASQCWFDDQHLRNLLSGAPVGASQVTSVVRSVPSRRHRRRYQVAFSAHLAAPFQVTLSLNPPTR